MIHLAQWTFLRDFTKIVLGHLSLGLSSDFFMFMFVKGCVHYSLTTTGLVSIRSPFPMIF